VGVHFQVVAYKELTTIPSEWEGWKRFLQGAVSSHARKLGYTWSNSMDLEQARN
jgi:hypothetical protein